MPIYLVYANGLMLGLSLIMSLGPQNIFLIRQAAMRQHALLSALTCFLCDAVLISASIMGLHHLLTAHPSFRTSMCTLGGLFLFYYAGVTLYRAFKPKKSSVTKDTLSSRLQIILLALGFSLLNPQAIIDSLIVIGGGSTQFPHHQRAFLLGVITSSLLWFMSLTFVTHHFSHVITRRNVWKCIECMSGLLMLMIGIKILCLG